MCRRGTVARFNAERGLGEVLTDDGRRLGFHCTAIADGSRRIDEGAAVSFVEVAGHLGRWEATELRQVDAV
jgi:cold shock CspA family protein